MIDRDHTSTIIRTLIKPTTSTLDLQVADLLNQYAVEVAQLQATIERVRLAGRDIMLKSMQGNTIIHDAGIMQDDAAHLAGALRGKPWDVENEYQGDLYVEAGFLTEEEA